MSNNPQPWLRSGYRESEEQRLLAARYMARADETEDVIRGTVSGLEDLGPGHMWGEIARLHRRYLNTDDPSVFHLSNSINGPRQASALVEVLPTLTELATLLLATNDIDDDVGRELVRCLATSPGCANISSLDLSSNRISHVTVLPLLGLLTRPPLELSPRATLHTLLLAGNASVGDIGATGLFRAMSSPYATVQILDLTRCGVGEKSSEALQAMLETNKCARARAANARLPGAWGGEREGGQTCWEQRCRYCCRALGPSHPSFRPTAHAG